MQAQLASLAKNGENFGDRLDFGAFSNYIIS
jgi:hypothetical protein